MGHIMKILVLKNATVLIDDEDFEWARQWLWRYGPHNKYVCRSEYFKELKRSVSYYLHREILKRMGPADFEQSDHINRNSLDNRRCNLRVSTAQQNSCNRGLRSENKSGYKGVYWNRLEEKWHAQLTTKGIKKQLGFHDTPEAAARAYNEAAKKHHGEFAFLNEIKE